ncbi:hypothetical protein BS639_17260 [Rouxiella silvae]|uniref:Tail spike TSP1/Gp66 N-terminal domain-containing protein n=1 Tax=Rouxiella silvae TaxID=1646373 RepID=A0ABX3TXS9_9GAMM|nr:hypothetical protein [Rouxiella silvae]ORJ20042.1 hypothetical protein BS639_17260 [Rouxiella silvae]
MANRYNTNSEVPSNTLPDLNDNMLVFDAFVNQESGSVISRKGVDIPVLQEQVGGRIDALTADAQAALTGAQASANEAAQSAAASGIIANNLGLPPGAGLVGYKRGVSYPVNSAGSKLSRWIDIEDYADSNAASGDWLSTIQTAINTAINEGITEIRGQGSYAISNTLNIQNIQSKGINLYLKSLSVTADFPTNTSFWDATPMINVGDMVSNITGLNIFIQTLDGGGKADGISAIGYGYALCHIHVGSLTNCIAGMRQGKHQWPNASNYVTGDNWANNRVGIYLADGTGPNAPITEGWHIDIKFMPVNSWGAIWYRRSGRYGRFNSDVDFNGQNLSIYQLSNTTGLDLIWDTQQLKLTNGTNTAEFLFYYMYQGYFYIVIGEDHKCSAIDAEGPPSFSVGDTLSCTTISGVALGVGTVNVCRDNASGTNYFDILHDFERGTFGKILVMCGYAAGIIGGIQQSSSFQFQNSFNGATDSLRGFGVSNSGSTLAFYNYAISNNPYSNITSDYVNFEKKLYLKDHRIVGGEVEAVIARSTTDYTTLLNFSDTSTDKRADEGAKFHVEILTNYDGCGASFNINVKAAGIIQVTKPTMLNGAFKFRIVTVLSSDGTSVVGSALQIRQESQDFIRFVINITRL